MPRTGETRHQMPYLLALRKVSEVSLVVDCLRDYPIARVTRNLGCFMQPIWSIVRARFLPCPKPHILPQVGDHARTVPLGDLPRRQDGEPVVLILGQRLLGSRVLGRSHLDPGRCSATQTSNQQSTQEFEAGTTPARPHWGGGKIHHTLSRLKLDLNSNS